MTQAVNEFFLSEDVANFTIRNDDSLQVAKPLWISIERHGNSHPALALGIGQTAIGSLMQFHSDTTMSYGKAAGAQLRAIASTGVASL